MNFEDSLIHTSFIESIQRHLGPLMISSGFQQLTPVIPSSSRSMSHCPFLRTAESIVIAFTLNGEGLNIDAAVIVMEPHQVHGEWQNYSIAGQSGRRPAFLASLYLEMMQQPPLTNGCLPPYGSQRKFGGVFRARLELCTTAMDTVIDCVARNLQGIGIEYLVDAASQILRIEEFTRNKLDLVLSEDKRIVMARVQYEYYKKQQSRGE